MGLTVTLQVADLSPQVAVMVASPTETAVTLPSISTVAIAASEVDHVTVLSVTSSGRTVAVNFSLAPMVRVSSVLSKAMLSASIGLTVTLQVAVLSPQVAVMVASPTATAVTLPSVPTVAIAASEVDQVTVLSVTSSGRTVAVNFSLAPMVRVSSVLSRVMLSASIGLTVTLQVADLSPQVAVMVASPIETAVTLPSLSTVAIDASEVDQVTVLSVTSSGRTVALSFSVSPIVRLNSVLSKVMLSASIGLTVTLQVADLSPHFAVMVASPTATAVTLPSASTVAIAASEVDQVTVLSVTSSGRTVAVSFSLAPMVRVSSVLSRVMLSASIGLTVTLQVAERQDPSTVEHVMFASPTEIAVTKPNSLTVATSLLSLIQTRCLFDALSGLITGDNLIVSPTTNTSCAARPSSCTKLTGYVSIELNFCQAFDSM